MHKLLMKGNVKWAEYFMLWAKVESEKIRFIICSLMIKN